jgi:alanyl-tRNA synthetase
VNYLEARSAVVDKLIEMLKIPAEQVAERVEKLLAENKKLAKDLKSAAKSGSADIMTEARALLDKAETVGGVKIIVGQISPADAEQARGAIDMLKKKAVSAAVVLAMADGDNVTILAGVTDDAIAKGVKAGDIVKVAAPLVGGGGGGRPQMAQAGGKNAKGIPDALAKAAQHITSVLNK